MSRTCRDMAFAIGDRDEKFRLEGGKGGRMARNLLSEPRILLAKPFRLVKHPFPGVLAVAGASVLAFRKSSQ
jgi:hypothetical protein